jgi:type II secretory pathway pseudopilin PulG
MRRLPIAAGTTLVELLVVIVVLLIGILAVIQIFPRGLKILTLNRYATIATALARDEAQRVIGRSERLAEQIIPVTYRFFPAQNRVAVFADADRSPNDLGIVPGVIDSQGNVFDSDGHMLGYWPYLSGPNLFRRVIGEGGPVPAPRQAGDYFGSLMVLQFTPIVYNASTPGLFQIYGADMVRKEGPPQESDRPQRFEYFVNEIDKPTAAQVLPADAFAQRTYRLALSCYITTGGTTRKRDIVDVTILVAPVTGGGFYTLPLAAGDAQNPNPLGLIAGETFQGAEQESVRAALIYDAIGITETFSDPYQYKLLDADMGLILFSDQAYKAYELRNGRRVPLQARVNYDVYDWRVMRDEFRVADGDVPQVKLALGNLKIKGNRNVDGTVYAGLSLNLNDGTGQPERRDLVLMDLDTGGVILERSASRTVNGLPKVLVRVDRSIGLLTFNDADDNPANGVQGEIVYPGGATAVDLNLTGRAIRAMYQARGEWAAQVMKAPALFTLSNAQPGIAQYYIGGSDTTLGGSTTRIYFAQSESGHRVTLDQVWYRRSTDTTARSLANQSFVVQSVPADPTGLAYIDILSTDADAQAFDTQSYGYAVAGVRGGSVTVRVLWNPSYLTFTSDPSVNIRNLEVWARDWRRTVAETYVRRQGE